MKQTTFSTLPCLIFICMGLTPAFAAMQPTQGDAFLPPPHVTGAIQNQGRLDAALDLLDNVRPSLGSEIRNDPTIEVTELLSGGEGLYGSHDNNTLALKTGLPLELVAMTLLHEYEHIQRAQANGDLVDSTTTLKDKNTLNEKMHAYLNHLAIKLDGLVLFCEMNALYGPFTDDYKMAVWTDVSWDIARAQSGMPDVAGYGHEARLDAMHDWLHEWLEDPECESFPDLY